MGVEVEVEVWVHVEVEVEMKVSVGLLRPGSVPRWLPPNGSGLVTTPSRCMS